MLSTVFASLTKSSSQFLLDWRLVLYTGLALVFANVLWRALHQLVLYPRFFSPLRSVPGPPLGGIVKGQFPAIITGEAGIPQRQWVKEYGPVVRVVGPIGLERLIFMNAAALDKILVSGWVDYPLPGFMRHIIGIVAGYGLLAVTGNEHKQMRKALSPAFSIPNLMAQTDLAYDAVNGLRDILQKDVDSAEKPETGKIIHMYEWMSKVMLDIICETAFGYTADSLHNPQNELADAYDKLIRLQTGVNLSLFVGLLMIPGTARLIVSDWGYRNRKLFGKIPLMGSPLEVVIESMYRIRKVSAELLEEKMRDSAVTSYDTDAKCDVMSLLVRARKSDMEESTDEYTMSDWDMMQQVLSFLAAGHETTASGLTWTMWLLANDIEAQTKLREEVSPLFSDPDARPDYRSLNDMEWLDCVIMESLRIFPPVPMSARVAGKTDYIDGVLVPEGTVLYIPIRVVNTWKEIWGEDAEEFKPGRWLNLPPNYNSTTSFLSFLAGPHGCIGKMLGLVAMKAVIATLITRFEFEPAFAGQTSTPTAAITMKPSDGLPLRVRAAKRPSL